MPSHNLTSGLNQSQLDAVTHQTGPLLVLAGAGSGKTRVLTHRISYLIAELGISPYQILAITFTKKAAQEMKERVGALVGPRAQTMWVSTFHSACARILRTKAGLLGYDSNYNIYDQADSKTLTKETLLSLGLDGRNAGMYQSLISRAKNEDKDPLVFAEELRDSNSLVPPQFEDVYRRYEQLKRSNNGMDFDDLLCNIVKLFEISEETLIEYQNKFQHVLVDEYQDTNPVQNKLIIQLAKEHRNICVVGDPDQSIYAFRAADIKNILQFENNFPDVTVIPLEQNYRSTQIILDAANSVIEQNHRPYAKNLWTDGEMGDQISSIQVFDEKDEAEEVGREIRKIQDLQKYALDDIAVFYRTNAQSRALEEVLTRNKIHYKVIGGLRFYERKEIKDALAYLNVLNNPQDDLSLERILNEPTRGIGKGAREILKKYKEEKGFNNLYEVLLQSQSNENIKVEIGGKEKQLSAGALKGVKKFLKAYLSIFEMVEHDLSLLQSPETTSKSLSILNEHGYICPQRALSHLLIETEYLESLEKSGDPITNATRIENLSELLGAADDDQYKQDLNVHEELSDVEPNHMKAVTLFLNNSSLTDSSEDHEGGSVSLMTLHSSKGLEYPSVFIMGMEDELFPFPRAIFEDGGLDEEHRLAYVGITRAEKNLYFTHAHKRTLHGQTTYNIPSRFIGYIPEHLITHRKSRKFESEMSSRVNQRSNFGSRLGGVQAWSDSKLGKDSDKSNADQIGLKVGDNVNHDMFGDGVIVKLEVNEYEAIATINFADEGQKTLDLSWAPVTKI